MKEGKSKVRTPPSASVGGATGVSSWKLFFALLVSLALGMAGGFFTHSLEKPPPVSDVELGLEISGEGGLTPSHKEG